MLADFFRQHIWLAALAAAASLVGAGCSGDRTDAEAATTESSPVLATVAGQAITEADLLAEAERRQTRRQPVPEKAVLLDAMITRAALVESAKRLELDEELEIRRAMDSVLVSAMKERDLGARLAGLSVSDDEIQAAYKAAAADYTKAPKARFSILMLESSKGASDGARAELRARLERARQQFIANPPLGGRGPAAQGFGALAINCSDDQVSRYRGGDAGWFENGSTGTRWPDDVLALGHSLSMGAVSPVVESAGNFYLVTKTAESAGTVTSVTQAASDIRRRLLSAKRKAAEQAFIAEHKQRVGVNIHSNALAKVVLAASAPSNSPSDQLKPPALPAIRP